MYFVFVMCIFGYVFEFDDLLFAVAFGWCLLLLVMDLVVLCGFSWVLFGWRLVRWCCLFAGIMFGVGLLVVAVRLGDLLVFGVGVLVCGFDLVFVLF